MDSPFEVLVWNLTKKAFNNFCFIFFSYNLRRRVVTKVTVKRSINIEQLSVTKPERKKRLIKDSKNEISKTSSDLLNSSENDDENNQLNISQTEKLFHIYLNQSISEDLEYQRKCLNNFLENFFETNKIDVLKKLVTNIQNENGFLPPPSPNLFPICRFNLQSQVLPYFEFYIKNSGTTINVLENFQNLDFNILNDSRMIYDCVYRFYTEYFLNK